jgi:hypothetical protein
MIKVMNILIDIRKKMEEEAYKKYGNHSGNDLCGFCDTAAVRVFNAIKNIVPTVIAGNDEHWFNIINHEGEELIVDITATQFSHQSRFQPIEVVEFPCEDYIHWETKYVVEDVASLKKLHKEQGWESVRL